ncbi:MAG: DUF4177 domain-containing protein [Pseudomonadota bacterium]
MQRYEYRVLPAPQKGTKAKGIRTPEGRFAVSVEALLNEMAAEGWEYQRAELLPSSEKSGIASSTINWRNVLVFRRALTVEHLKKEAIAPPTPAPVVEMPKFDPHGVPLARPVPGPEEIQLPDPIPAEVDEPPLSATPEPVDADEPPLTAEPEPTADEPQGTDDEPDTPEKTPT